MRIARPKQVRVAQLGWARSSPNVRISAPSLVRLRPATLFRTRKEERALAPFLQAPTEASVGMRSRSAGEDPRHRNATHSPVVPWAGGRLHGPDDAQVEPREVAVGRRATSHRSSW